MVYGNEKEAGEGIKRALDEGIIKREDLFVTSKLWNTCHRKEHVLPALQRTLADLQLDYLDLYLIHFPVCLKFVPFEERFPAEWIHDPESAEKNMQEDLVPVYETWGAMEEMVGKGLTKHIGVSNFNIALIRDMLSYCKIQPAVLQVEIHPYLAQPKLLKFCKERNIAVTGYSSLGAPSYIDLGYATKEERAIDLPLIAEIAKAHNKSPAQVVLKWSLQRQIAIIPKSNSEARVLENVNLFDFVLTKEQMDQINALDRHRRFNDPGHYCQAAFNTFYPIYD